MGFFKKKTASKPTADSKAVPIARRESSHLLPEVEFYELANQLIAAAGPEVEVDKSVLLERIYRTVVTQANISLEALRHPEDAEVFTSLFKRPDFTDQMLWDFLTMTPYRVAVHNQIVELLTSEEFQETFIETIREGNMK